ncbi:MAG: hypothetical protein HY536_00605 [Candidatus Colwellbacteria bacterium]|nr:hypothetical protein [Candidatus Colwellbacteria bacterium]
MFERLVDKRLLAQVGVVSVVIALAGAFYVFYPAPLTPEVGRRFLAEASAKGEFELTGARNVARHFVTLDADEVERLLELERRENPHVFLFPQFDISDARALAVRETAVGDGGVARLRIIGGSRQLEVRTNLSGRVAVRSRGGTEEEAKSVTMNETDEARSVERIFEGLAPAEFEYEDTLASADAWVWAALGEPILKLAFVGFDDAAARRTWMMTLDLADNHVPVPAFIANILAKDGKIVLVRSAPPAAGEPRQSTAPEL